MEMEGIKRIQIFVFVLYSVIVKSCHGSTINGLREEIVHNAKIYDEIGRCSSLLTPAEIHEIESYKDLAHKIMNHTVNGTLKGETYRELKSFTELFRFRPPGSSRLESAIDYMMNIMKHHGLEHVRSEPISVPIWNMTNAKAKLMEPVEMDLTIVGLDHTAPLMQDIKAHVLVVRSFEQLDEKHDQVKGKIVVYNQGYLGLSSSSHVNLYRTHGASHAAQYGAVAVLIQSTSFLSIENPKSIPVKYWTNVTAIPAALISLEDAGMLYHFQEQGKSISITLHIAGTTLPMKESRNIITEIEGKNLRKEFVSLIAHMDCMNSDGGASDASGVLISVMAMAGIKEMGLVPRRTLEMILFTGSESGLWGVDFYVQKHKQFFNGYSAVLQSDGGAYKQKGIDFAGSEKAGCMVHEILKLCEPLHATSYARFPSVSSDIASFIAEGVPGLSLRSGDDDTYTKSRRHNDTADTISAFNSDELDRAVALWSVTSYVLADIHHKLPRH